MAKKQFVHLHVHSEYSLLDGCGLLDNFVERAKELGQSHIAFTEHGSMRGYYALTLAAQNIGGIKPIYGIEFYMCPDHSQKGLTDDQRAGVVDGLAKTKHKEAIKQEEKRLGIRHRWHLCAWAKNNEGLKNLFRLSSLGWTHGFYYAPRIDREQLAAHAEGLIVSSACVGSRLDELLIAGDIDAAVDEAAWYKKTFGNDYFIELMPHDFDEQFHVNPMLVQVAQGLDIPLIATNDAHYIRRENAKHQEVLLCVQTNDTLDNPGHFSFSGDSFWLRSREEMLEAFERQDVPTKVVEQALENTVMLAERCEAEVVIDRFKCLVPAIEVPKAYVEQGVKTSEDYLLELIAEGWEMQRIDERIEKVAAKQSMGVEEMRKVYEDRLEKELVAIKKQKFIEYMLLVHDIYVFCREKDIMTGPGRGSVGGSIVAFLLGLTAVDPIEHGLIFERFISPARIDMPDVDMDFEDARRKEVILYIMEKYGQENTSQISTDGRLKGKACLRDVCRVLNIPHWEVGEVTKAIVERSSGDERASQTVEDSFKEFDVCREFNEKYPEVLPLVRDLEGQVRQVGIHAAGVVASPVPIVDVVPLETRQTAGWDYRVPVTAVNYEGAMAMGLLKLDVLGLRTLSVIKDALRVIKRDHGKDIDMVHLDKENPEVLQMFTDMDFIGVFQFDTTSAFNACRGVVFHEFETIPAMTALNRPGTARSGISGRYKDRQDDLSKVKKVHPIYDKITRETLGLMVYQEQVTRLFIELSGYEPGTADSLRKKIAKKWGDEALGKEREKFIEGAVSKGMAAEQAGKLMDDITFFGSYAFNKAHSVEYGLIAYWSQWLKCYYPLEFFWSLLRHEPDRKEVARIAKEISKRGIKVLPPDVRTSKKEFAIDREHNAIRCSLVDIKGVGEKAAEDIAANAPYSDIVDFYARTDGRKVNKRVVGALIQASAMDFMFPNTRWACDNIDQIHTLGVKSRTTSASGRELLRVIEASRKEPSWSDDDRMQRAIEVCPMPGAKHQIELYQAFIDEFVGDHIEFLMLDDDETWERKHGWFRGIVVDIRYNQVGDFHTSEPDEDEKRRIFWGARYSNINIEDESGAYQRVKFDIDNFEMHRSIIDKGEGTPVIFHAGINKKNRFLHGDIMVDLGAMKRKIDAGEVDSLTYWEVHVLESVVGHHWRKNIERYLAKKSAGRKHVYVQVIAIVMRNRLKIDKRDQEMGFITLGGHTGAIQCICFGSYYPKVKDKLKVGNVLKLNLKVDGKQFFIDDRSSITVLQSAPSAESPD